MASFQPSLHFGLAIGLGTYRGVYGKFFVEKWE